MQLKLRLSPSTSRTFGGENSFGELLRRWRTLRNLSQLELALAADVSSRHVSFLESGRARSCRPLDRRSN